MNETVKINFLIVPSCMWEVWAVCVSERERDRETETKKEAYVKSSNFVINFIICNHIL